MIFPVWWVSGAFLFCHPCEIALATVPRQFPPGSGSWRVGFLSLCFMTAGDRTGSLFVQLHELQTVTANSLCSSLQVESLDIRYVSGMKEADSLFRSLSLSLAGTTWGRDVISSSKSITDCSASCWCCAMSGLVPSTCWMLSPGSMCVEMAGLEEQVKKICWFGMSARATHAARLMPQTLGALAFPCPFLTSYNSWGCKTDPEVQVCLRLRVAEGQNCHRGACPCPLPPWGLLWDAAQLHRPGLFTHAGVLLGCAGCWSAMSHRSMSGAAGSVSVCNTSALSHLPHWG